MALSLNDINIFYCSKCGHRALHELQRKGISDGDWPAKRMGEWEEISRTCLNCGKTTYKEVENK